MATTLIVRDEAPEDVASIRGLHALAFDDGGKVPQLVDALRAARAPIEPMSFVAALDGRVVGHVMLTAGRLDAPRRIVDVYVLSPLGVLPSFQRQGVGTKLIGHALAAAEQKRVPLAFLEGSPRYYRARGFERAAGLGFRSPSLRIPEPAFQVARLSSYELWMTGTLVFSETFWALDCVGLREPTVRLTGGGRRGGRARFRSPAPRR
jgi:putative acetyltransferase